MRSVLLGGALLLAATMPFTVSSTAQTPEQPGQSVMRRAEAGAPVFDEAGFRVTLDRSTGRLRRLTADEAHKYGLKVEDLYNITGRGLVVHQAENGMLSIVLNADYLDYSVVRIANDGTIATACVTGDSASRTAIAQSECIAAAEEK